MEKVKRRVVGKRKLEDLEYFENKTGISLSDEVWNALAELNGLQIMQLTHEVSKRVRQARQEALED